MALDMRDRSTVGCCYYVAREEKLYLMEDVQLGGLGVIDACKNIHKYMKMKATNP
jgi:DNA mismatch repair protein MSH5